VGCVCLLESLARQRKLSYPDEIMVETKEARRVRIHPRAVAD
jgi:hypothetical protein